jgi:hypothetical protein
MYATPRAVCDVVSHDETVYLIVASRVVALLVLTLYAVTARLSAKCLPQWAIDDRRYGPLVTLTPTRTPRPGDARRAKRVLAHWVQVRGRCTMPMPHPWTIEVFPFAGPASVWRVPLPTSGANT